jgi:hypothetical protein
MAKLAALTGYTTGSASVTFGNIKRKLKLLGEGLAAAGPTTPKKGISKSTTTPRSTGKRGAKVGDDVSPTKRAKKAPTKKVHDDDNEDDDDDEHFIPNIKKEEVNDVTERANVFFEQMQNVGGYDFEHDDS